jgi:hypothetical protein
MMATLANGAQLTGRFALELGAQVPGRLVASAKSWLSHASVDRMAPILPWGAEASCRKVSPVAASASYLAHVRAAWLHRFPQAPLEQQQVILTVPASFDEGARALTSKPRGRPACPSCACSRNRKPRSTTGCSAISKARRHGTRRNAAADGLRRRRRHHRPDADPGERSRTASRS